MEKQGRLGKRKRGHCSHFAGREAQVCGVIYHCGCLQIKTSEATGAQTQGADSLSASRFFSPPKEN